ncbi:hypothetical protein [Mesorhizobium sp. WSM2239]|uniref:Lacal_2735 family protein n=2 Tax=unclassified Mesorhizobium TaxID=325217 RepID=A0AAU8D6U7_9HYPH
MTKPEKITEKQLAAARKVMARYDVAFSILAQGDASPHMTEEFRAKLTEADRRLEKYRVASSQ